MNTTTPTNFIIPTSPSSNTSTSPFIYWVPVTLNACCQQIVAQINTTWSTILQTQREELVLCQEKIVNLEQEISKFQQTLQIEKNKNASFLEINQQTNHKLSLMKEEHTKTLRNLEIKHKKKEEDWNQEIKTLKEELSLPLTREKEKKKQKNEEQEKLNKEIKSLKEELSLSLARENEKNKKEEELNQEIKTLKEELSLFLAKHKEENKKEEETSLLINKIQELEMKLKEEKKHSQEELQKITKEMNKQHMNNLSTIKNANKTLVTNLQQRITNLNKHNGLLCEKNKELETKVGMEANLYKVIQELSAENERLESDLFNTRAMIWDAKQIDEVEIQKEKGKEKEEEDEKDRLNILEYKKAFMQILQSSFYFSLENIDLIQREKETKLKILRLQATNELLSKELGCKRTVVDPRIFYLSTVPHEDLITQHNYLYKRSQVLEQIVNRQNKMLKFIYNHGEECLKNQCPKDTKEFIRLMYMDYTRFRKDLLLSIAIPSSSTKSITSGQQEEQKEQETGLVSV